MKKFYLPFILIVMLIVMMSAGSLAIYTQTKTLRGHLYTRVFLFNANEMSTSYELGLSGLKLAPGSGEKELYRFELTNTNSATEVCDYNLSVSIASSGMAQALDAMSGLVFRLYNVTSESGTPVATISSGELATGGIVFPAGAKQTIQYKLTAQWNDTGDSVAQTAVASSGTSYVINLSVSAESIN